MRHRMVGVVGFFDSALGYFASGCYAMHDGVGVGVVVILLGSSRIVYGVSSWFGRGGILFNFGCARPIRRCR